jgi:ABC-2 type transport system ATP-binding protein
MRAEGVTKRYGARVALDAVSVAIEPGERVAVIGANGAGKTTFLQILAGVLEADGGTIEVDGRVGWVPQQPAVYAKLSVAENLRLFARLEGVGDVDRCVERMLVHTGLEERARDEVGKLSGGNRQRVNVAVGLLGDPSVLLLDEPTTAVDPRQRERMWDVLTSVGTTLVFSTHAIAEARQHATRILVLDEGRIVHDAPATDPLPDWVAD